MARGKKVGSIYTEIRARMDKLERDYSTAHTKTKGAARKIQRSINKISFNKPSDSFRRFTRLFGAGIAGYGIKSLATAALDVASSFEIMEIKLDSLTRGRGKETLDELNAWALEMPVNTRKAVDTFVMMQAMGLDPTIAKMQTLVDVSSIFGAEAMPRVARALGQMATLGKLSAEELNQMSEAGINARKYLTAAFGMTVEELQKSQISIEQIIDAIWKGLDADFSGAAKKAQRSWQGLTVTFKSYMDEMARVVMDAGIFDALKGALDEINKKTAAWLEKNRALIAVKVPEYVDRISTSISRLISFYQQHNMGIQKAYDAMIDFGDAANRVFGGAGRSAEEWVRRTKKSVDDYSHEMERLRRNVTTSPEGLSTTGALAMFESPAVARASKTAAATSGGAPGAAPTGKTKPAGGTAFDIRAFKYSTTESFRLAVADSKMAFDEMSDHVRDYQNVVIDSYTRMDAFTDQTFSGAADSVAQFATSGKFEFKSFADSVIHDLLRIQARMALSGLFESVIGAAGGFFGSTNVPTIRGGQGGGYGFQHGGHLGEGVVGFGVKSGKSYEFHPNESVIPDSKMGGSNITVYNISAMDAASFVEFARRTGAVPMLAAENLDSNGILRKSIQQNL